MRADVDLGIGRKTSALGLLPELIDVLRRGRPGDLVATRVGKHRAGSAEIHS
jgi:hypothetical protein